MKVNLMDWPVRPDLEATIAQQQARIEVLEAELGTGGRTVSENKREGLEAVIAVGSQWMERAIAAEQALTAERERADTLEREAEQHDLLIRDTMREKDRELQAEREKSAEAARAYLAMQKTSEATWRAEVERLEALALTTQAPEADHVGGLMSIPVYKATQQARIEALERQLERHAGLLHNAVHNWALYSVADCPEMECEEYRALERIKQ